MYTQLGMFAPDTATAQQETASAASITLRQYCKRCRRTPAALCEECRTWRRDYDSVRDCLLSVWPASYADSVTLRLRGLYGDVAETGTERHIREYRSLLSLAGVGQEETCQNV